MSANTELRQLDRLAFFSDAIFAIAITLLVIDVRLPHFGRQVGEIELANALLALIPQYIGFFVSFWVIGRFWVGHHHAFGHLIRADDRLIWLNLAFMMTIAFMPFPTSLVSGFASLRVGIGLYAGWLTLAGLLNVAVMRHLARGHLLDAGVDPATSRRWVARAWSPVAIGVLAFAFGMVQPLLAMVPLVASPLIVRLFGRYSQPRQRKMT